MGNVSLPHSSRGLTISFVISLHDLQTEAQKTTTVLAGQDVTLSSTLRITSKSSSGGKFAHCPCSIGWEGAAKSGAICDLGRLRQCFPSTPRLDMLPTPSFISFISRTMFLNDILSITPTKCFLQNENALVYKNIKIPWKLWRKNKMLVGGINELFLPHSFDFSTTDPTVNFRFCHIRC